MSRVRRTRADAGSSAALIARLLLPILLIGCGRESTLPDPAPGPGPGGEPGTAARVVITPGALMLAEAGQVMQLTATVFDATGQKVQTPVSWQSSNPGLVSVSSSGLATAAAGVGSAGITATAQGISSQPALAIVARPAAGVVLIADSLILTDPVAVSATASYEPGWQYRIRMRGTAPTPGTLVIGTGGRALAGRVVAATAQGAETELLVELASLNQLFADLKINETIPLVEIESESTLRPHGPSLVQGAPDFTLGRFKCTASGEIPSLDLPNPTLNIRPHLSLVLGYSNGLEKYAVVGGITADFGYKPVFKAVFEGKASCETVLRTVTLPLGLGPLALFFGIQVPIGIGFELDGKLEIAEVGFDVSAHAEATVELGLLCPGAGGTCTGITNFNTQRDFDFTFIAPNPTEQFKLTLGAKGFLFARPSVGTAFSASTQFAFLEATAGVKQSIDLATATRQVMETDYASGFALQGLIDVGPGKDLQTAIEKLEKLLGTDLDIDLTLVAVADTLAESPKGTFTISPDAVEPGDDEALGEMATFTVELEPVTYLGIQSVEQVEFFWKKDDGEGGFTLDLGRPSCTVLAASSGQTRFECQTDFLEEQRGSHTFYAFVHAKLFGVPLPIPLEVAVDAAANVHVGALECPAPPEWAVAFVEDESEISSGSGSVTLDGPDLSYLSLSAGARTESNGGWSPVPYIDGEITDFVRIIPLTAVGNPDGYLWAKVQIVAQAEAEIIGGTCCGRFDDGTAEITLGSDWMRGSDPATGTNYPAWIEATAGASWSGDLPRKDTEDMNGVYLVRLGRVSEFDDDTHWIEMTSWIDGNARHRGSGNAAVISASLELTLLDIVDDAGTSVPAQVCSAAGFDYGLPTGGEPGMRAVAARPTRQGR